MTAAAGRSYGGLSAGERAAQRRERLLGTALQVIGTEGYAGATIPRMCAEAKVSTRNFYEMYSSKEDLFVDLYDGLTAASYERVATSLAATEGRPLRERVPAALLAYVNSMLSDPRVARIAFVEIMGASPRIEKLRLDYRETLIALVTREGADAAARGEVSETDWRFAALALVGAVTAIVYDWALGNSGQTQAQLEDQLSELAVSLLVR